MYIVSNAEDLLERSKHYFLGKIRKKIFQNMSVENFTQSTKCFRMLSAENFTQSTKSFRMLSAENFYPEY